MPNIQKNLIMKKEYIKPFAKVRIIEPVLMLPFSGKGEAIDPQNIGAKENVIDFLLENM